MSFQKSQHLRWLGHARTALASMSMALSLCHVPAMAVTPSDEVPIANFTPYNDVPALVRERLSDDLKSLVREKQLTVFVLASEYEGPKACLAVVGLSYRAPKGLNPRVPGYWHSAHSSGSDRGDWKASECVSNRLLVAVEGMNKSMPEEVLRGLDDTAEGGVPLEAPANSDTVSLREIGLSAAAKEAVFETLHEHDVGKLLDYRRMQTTIFATSTAFKGGDIMCTVDAGVAARTPDGRNMRWPGFTHGMVRVQTGGTPEGCVEILAPEAVSRMLKQPWSGKGIFRNIDKTREAGVALPDIKALAAKREAVLKKRVATERAVRTQQARSVSTKALTCTNECFNGACVRTFPNGRKERWQAPRAFNPMTQNWDWDITTNACGG